MKLNLASDDVKTKTRPKKNSYYVTDTVEGRLQLKIHPSGVRTYHYAQGIVHGVRKRPKLARFEETTASIMRSKVREYNHQQSKGLNPFAEDLEKLTLGMFLEDVFMPEKQKPTFGSDGTRFGVSEKEYKNRMSMINAHIRDGIGKILLKEMSYAAVDAFMRKVSIKSATQARNIRVFLIDAWREALRRHENLRLPNYFEMYDIKSLNKQIRKNSKGKRPLDKIEGPAIHAAIEAAIEDEPFIARCIKLISLLTTRKMDLATLRFESIEYDKDAEKYYFENYNEKSDDQYTYFGKESAAILEEIKLLHKQKNLIKFQHLFPQFKNGRYVDKHITEGMLRTVWEGSGHGKITGILGKAAETAPTLLGTKKLPKFTLHDFRDTAATYTEEEDSQYALGHTNPDTTRQSYRKILKGKFADVSDRREGAMKSILDAKD